ncbi:hypothetical protein CLIB1444_25S00386 [[Candida] jaroonii]|uniref:Uncharacterized protein n=1 Tax=[Candida] jaroonii TaxID=467808 RepID=A0ACA9YGP5_9ASCO|nr:hypothetical protein CLIB1444_25S00386 [[Candida] jaroonii]
MSSPSLCSPNCLLQTQDYFAIKRNNKERNHSTPDGRLNLNIRHHNFNDSISSMTSDSTVDSELKKTDSIISSSTLIDESPQILATKLPTLSINEENEEKKDLYGELSPFNNLNHYKVRASSLVDLNFQPPPLTKHVSSPTIKTFNEIKRPHQDYTESIKALSPNIEYLDSDQLQNTLSQLSIDKDLNLPNMLIIDVRSFTDYITNHLKYAINICLPSTLLKRPNFSFIRCVNSLPLYEKLLIKSYYNNEQSNIMNNNQKSSLEQIKCSKFGFPSILIYDTTNNSINMYYMIKKILQDKNDVTIYIANEGFGDLNIKEEFSETGNKPLFNVDDLMNNDTNLMTSIPITKAPNKLKTLNVGPHLVPPDRFRSNSLNDLRSPVESSTPVLSNFKLPPTALTPSFKIRHNEETFDHNKLGIDLLTKYDLQHRKLPSWINLQRLQESKLIAEFNNIETFEKNRLNNILNINNNGINKEISISSGIEKGHKNRYKDIFLYDHSRVKLKDFNQPQQCDYINASYINSIDKLYNTENINNFKYIASQGPLKHTIGDFYKSIINNNTKLIIALTDEFENGMIKCDPYWAPGIYFSNGNKIAIKINSVEKANDNLIFRKIQITTDTDTREIVQIQLLNWLDNEICGNFDDLMKIVRFKQSLMKDPEVGINDYATLIHCSAGCGRTGTFITIDSIINLIENNVVINEDIIFNIVGNLRLQRISMVQNLRQFISIYEMVIRYTINE